MSWRTIVITSRAKLSLKMKHIIIRQPSGTSKVFLGEVALLIIESTAVSITACLIDELSNHKIKVIFCDAKRNPSSELLPYYGSHNTSLKIKQQMNWSKNIKEIAWTEIIRQKIKQQLFHLEALGKSEWKLLKKYLDELQHNDQTNREGHAAKVYFNALFGKGFSRSQDNDINAGLNYGYSIILSIFNREIVAQGFLTQLGLFHDNQFNEFNLSSDLMEPFRILVDRKVISLNVEQNGFDEEMRYQLINLLNEKVEIDGKSFTVLHAIQLYVKSIFNALELEDPTRIKDYRNEL